MAHGQLFSVKIVTFIILAAPVPGNVPEGLHSGIENGDAHAREQAKVCFD